MRVDRGSILDAAELAVAGQLLAATATAVRAEAARRLLAPLDVASEPIDWANGATGLALFLATLARSPAPGDDSPDADARLACALRDRAIEGMASHPLPPGLFEGIAGIALGALQVEALLGRFDVGAVEEVDAYLQTLLERTDVDLHFDVVSGLVGIGSYFLSQPPRPAASGRLRQVVHRLAQSAEPRPVGVAWRTHPGLMPAGLRAATPRGHFDLGLAHGTPGVVAFLARAVAASEARDLAEPLLRGAVAWLLTQEGPKGRLSRYGSWIADIGKPEPARTGWCYGDAGVALAVLAAATALGQGTWRRWAIELALGAAERAPSDTGVRDAGLCHGAAGLMHIFHRLYQATGDRRFVPAIRRWFQAIAAGDDAGREAGAFARYVHSPAPHWVTDAGLLCGSAGVGLALHSLVVADRSEWDRPLMTSVGEWYGGAVATADAAASAD